MVKTDKLPVLYAADFRQGGVSGKRSGHGINLDVDSYVLAFVGPRGAGKTATMSLFAAKAMLIWGKRVISNYAIKFRGVDIHGKSKVYQSEPLDIFELLTFDGKFNGCIFLLDEAASLISHMASTTWRNRLLSLFFQQIRKGRNSLMYSVQNSAWVDKSLRWQVDCIFWCRDASRRYSDGHLKRGQVFLMDVQDISGQWTGYSYDEREIMYPFKVKGQKLWDVYDSYETQDVFESLARVDMQRSSRKVGPGQTSKVDSKCLEAATSIIQELMSREEKTAWSRDFFAACGPLSATEKNTLTKHLHSCDVRRGQGSSGKHYYDFSGFNIDRFMAGVNGDN